MKQDPTKNPIDGSRLSERILQREIASINATIRRFQYNGGRDKTKEKYINDVRKMEKTARELEKDLEFLRNYRAYLTREVDEIETFRFDV